MATIAEEEAGSTGEEAAAEATAVVADMAEGAADIAAAVVGEAVAMETTITVAEEAVAMATTITAAVAAAGAAAGPEEEGVVTSIPGDSAAKGLVTQGDEVAAVEAAAVAAAADTGDTIPKTTEDHVERLIL